MDPVKRDERFSHIGKDKRFRKMPRHLRKVKIDERFKAMFTDERFMMKQEMDKRGRPVRTTANENLKNYYDLSSESDDSGDDDNDDDISSDDSSPSDDINVSGDNESMNLKNQKEKNTTLDEERESEIHKAEKNKNKKLVKKVKQISPIAESHNQSVDEEVVAEGERKRNKVIENKKAKLKQDLNGEDSKQQKVKKNIKEKNLKEDIDETEETDEASLEKVVTKKMKNKEKVKMKKPKSRTDDHQPDLDKKDSEQEEETFIEKKKAEKVTDKKSPSKDSLGIDSNKTSNTETKKKSKKKKKKGSSGKESDEELDPDFIATSKAILQGVDVARGEGNLLSSSDDESEDSGVEDGELDHRWNEMENDAVEAKEITRRLALCNMDWDRIKAQDIFMLMNSFKPTGGTVEHVKIYPSEYGLKRMEEDNTLGPVELRGINSEKRDIKSIRGNKWDDYDEYSEEAREKLRQYQLNRLKYYYAVITCDTSQTADAIYDQCDGMEYESSSARIDLRFIPDDMEFEHEPKSVADKILDVNYIPSQFVSTALRQSKVKLTWEETDPDRLKQTMRKFTKDEVEELDLKNYLASDSEDDEAKNEMNKFRSLLGGEESTDKKYDPNMEMEISWEPGLKEDTEQALKKKSNKGQTPWEKYLERKAEKRRQKLDEKMKEKKEKRRRKRAEIDGNESDDIPEGVDLNDPFFREELDDDALNALKSKTKKEKERKLKKKKKEEQKEVDPDLDLLVMDDDDEKEHFSLDAIMKAEKNKKKKKAKHRDPTVEKDTFQLDTKDERFAAMFTSSAYNIDPSAPEYKKTQAMQNLVNEKMKMKRSFAEGSDHPVRKAAKQEETKPVEQSLQSLVKSVKAKAKLSQKQKNKFTSKK